MTSRLEDSNSVSLMQRNIEIKTAGHSKRALDVLFSLLVLSVIWPLFLIIAIAIKMESEGPVIFKQKREGLNGRPFMIFKFRSMKVHAESNVVTQAKKDDARVTKVGKFIRKTSLDELPQFVNVLIGDMSVVGPRPHAAEHNEFYENKINNYRVREKVKPGITGLAQITGFRGETETLEKMQMRINVDLEYIASRSLWGDFLIIIKTPVSLLKKDAY